MKLVSAMLALSLFANAAQAFTPYHTAQACRTVVSGAIDAVNAVPFTKRILDGRLSKSWYKSFDTNMYRTELEKFRAMDNLGLEEWGFAETQLAYLSALIEKASGMKITLADTFIDDPTHARALQLLCRDMDFSKNLTRHQLKKIIERAYVLTGKLDLDFADFRAMDSERVRTIMIEHAWKEIAKVGVVELYEKMGLLKKPSLKDKLLKLWDNPYVSTGLLIPTWLTAPAKLRPGYLPEVQWVRFNSKTIRAMLENGIEATIEAKGIEGRIKTYMKVQRTYDFVRHVVAIWAGVFFVGYALGTLVGMTDEDVLKWVTKQGSAATDSLREEFIRTGGELPENP